MDIYLNNQKRFLEKEKPLLEFFTELNITFESGIAIAVNNAVIPKSEWNKITLHDNDKIILIKATAGG